MYKYKQNCKYICCKTNQIKDTLIIGSIFGSLLAVEGVYLLQASLNYFLTDKLLHLVPDSENFTGITSLLYKKNSLILTTIRSFLNAQLSKCLGNFFYLMFGTGGVCVTIKFKVKVFNLLLI